jgi:hypothetical protein
VWAGPGVYHGRGPIDQGGGTIVEETEGFIIDRHAGIAGEHPSGLPQYQVSFWSNAYVPMSKNEQWPTATVAFTATLAI